MAKSKASSAAMAGGRDTFESIYGPPKGKMMETTHGTTHYILEGNSDTTNEKKPLVVLIHGIGGHSGLFDKIAADLLAKGDAGQVLRYDFYDRGYSETSKRNYPIVNPGIHPLAFTLDLHTQQLRDVLTGLNLTHKKMILCGHSTGGVTAFGFAAQYHQSDNSNNNNIAGLILIDTVSLPIPQQAVAHLAKIPCLGNFLIRNFGPTAFAKFAHKSLAQPHQMKDFLQKLQQNVTSNPRFFAAVRSTNEHCKGFSGTSAEDEFRTCCNAKIPIHLIWGKDDTAIPYAHCCTLKKIAQELGTAVTEESYEGMPHNVFFEDAKPDEVSHSICDFVAK